MSFFITGTDTGAGKTYITALLLRALRAAGIDAVGMKPLCCGDRGDAEILHAASGGEVPINDINPIWLRTPAAPFTAALIENRVIDLNLIREAYARMQEEHRAVLVEGVGGWMVPILQDYGIHDLATELGLPVIVVAGNRLGALNHTLLTTNAIQVAGVPLLGVILNHVISSTPEEQIATTTNRGILETVMEGPVLLEVEHGDAQIPETLVNTLVSRLRHR